MAVIILFFTSTSAGFFGKIKGFTSYSNVDSVIEGCNINVDTNQEYSFCCEKRDVKYLKDGGKTEGEFTCESLRNESFGKSVKELNCEEVSC